MSYHIIRGDARTSIVDVGDVDVVITDPVWPNCPPGLLSGWERPADLLHETLSVLPASVKRIVVIVRSDSDPRFLSAMPARWPFVCTQALPYAVPMYIGRVLGGTELAFCFGAPIPAVPGRRVIPMWGPKAQPRDRLAVGHPCSRALVHMAWLVSWWSQPGETVLDPFCGSGTIPLAAHQQGRHGVGIEIDTEYAALAEQRLEADPPRLPLVERGGVRL